MTQNVAEVNGISWIATAGPVVRNDEATGSIPVSSTNIAWRFLVAARNAGQQLLRRGATASGKFWQATLFQAKGVNYDS